MTTRIIIADPHPVFLMGMERLLNGEPFISVLAYCGTATETLKAVRDDQPDVLILDLGFRDFNGLDVIRDLRRDNLPVKVIVLTAALDDEQTIETLRLGVQGVLLKNMPAHLLPQCIRKVHAGGQWLEKQSLGHAFEKMLRREAGARRMATILTERETEIMCLVAQGLSNREIGERIAVGEGTVKVHVHNIYSKLGVNNRVDLTLYAQKKGLV
ncbi:MAG: response regulator transcription factor [Desulfuromonas sp.]|nr:response regulator transcription factor [Desulfuromonas sp.]